VVLERQLLAIAHRRSIQGCALGVAVLLSSRSAHAGEDDLALDLGDKTILELRRIPKGTFVQGSPATEAGRDESEVVRNVTLSRPYWIGKVPVTRGQFSQFVSETRHVTDAEKGVGGVGFDAKTGTLTQKKDFTWRSPGFPQKDEDPVVLVTFGDAVAFTGWASRKTARRIRLPTEAEWEYAARAGTTTPWFGASKEEEALALGWFRANAGGSTHPVAMKKANAWGLFDMTGNVHQWCRDVFATWSAADVTDPETSSNPGPEPERRVLRGGSWLKDPKRARSASRHRSAAGNRSAETGFRVAMDEDPPTVRAEPPDARAPAAQEADAGGATAVTKWGRPEPTGAGLSLLIAPVAAAAAAVLWVALRRRRGTLTNGFLVRAARDGFWIRGADPSKKMRYTCIVSGREVSDVVPLDGGEETFVYTGGWPSGIRLEPAPEPSPSRAALPRIMVAVESIHMSVAEAAPENISPDEVYEGVPNAY
jgi:formylglycine-generating enzyme